MFVLSPKKLLPLVLCLFATSAMAFSFADLSNQDATGGLKAALEKGSLAAVAKLGVENGFLDNGQVRIELPRALERARPLLQLAGKGQQLDDLVLSMNHAAEAAVPMAKPLLLNAVRGLTVQDAKNILTGGDTSVEVPVDDGGANLRRRLFLRTARREQCARDCDGGDAQDGAIREGSQGVGRKRE